MARLSARWQKLLDAEPLQRSSQVVSVVGQHAYIFGGELRPREPRDNHVHVVALGEGQSLPDERPSNARNLVQTGSLTTHPAPSLSSNLATSQSPSARVGTASATLNGKIYLFSGRGGVAMAPIEERGSVWEFDPAPGTWSLVDSHSEAFPAARSYHCMTSDGSDTLYLHAGCPEKGRLADLWAFSLSRKQWTELAPAVDPPRGGTSITFVKGKLYRMNGFDGKTEQGGSVDIYCPVTNSWTSHAFPPDGKSGPTPRSVSVLVPVLRDGRDLLLTMFGERDPSSLGHQGAGKMLDDVWAFDVESKTWAEVDAQGDEFPVARGWFDADAVDANTVVVHGGLGESNNRLGDIWKLELV